MFALDFLASLPEPGSLVIIGSGLIILALLLRKGLSAITGAATSKETPPTKPNY